MSGVSDAPERVQHEAAAVERTNAVSLRSVLVGLLLVPVNCYWVIAAELRWYFILTINPLFVTPIFYLFLLVGGNAVIRSIAPRYVFRPAEMVVIYVMLVMSCTIATHDYIINLMSSMGWAGWFGTPQNQWDSMLFPHLPRWLLVWDKQVLTGFFNGNRSLAEPGVLAAWLAPLAFWSIFIFASGWIMMCMTTILRKAWTEETRLSFPIVRLPLVMTNHSLGEVTLGSKVLWAGFAFAAGLSLVNGLRLWYPNLPDLGVRARWLSFPLPPWNAIGAMTTTYYPFAIGLAFLVPLDVSFSCWFFYLFAKAQAVIGHQLGYGSVRDSPFLMEQGIGAWTAFGIALLYMSRHYLRHVVRLALGPSKGEDRDEPMPYRVAFWGLVLGMLVFLAFWCLAGMGLIWALLVLALYLLLSICVTRVRAEAGGQHTVWDLEPLNVFRLFDSQMLGPGTMAAGAMSHWYWRLNRSHMMPAQMESLKLAREHGINLRSLVLPMMAALVVATAAGMWSCLHVLYRDGGLAKCQGFAVWTGIESYTWLENGLRNGFHAEPGRWGVVGGAAGFVFLLSSMRARFVWFPFHPLGYCIGPALIWLWLPFLIAWAAKLMILHFGGLRLYRRSLPFFLGLVLGDYVAGAVWSLIGIWWELPTHQIFH